MPTTIRMQGAIAEARDREWHSSDALMQRHLTWFCQPDRTQGYIPDWDYAMAQAAVELGGAEIISHEDAPFDPDAIY